MARQGWKSLALAGLLGTLGLTVGCNDRHDGTVRDQAREVGQQVGKAARDVQETTHEAVEGFKEGVGGSGEPRKEDVVTVDKPGGVHTSERPIKENKNR